MMRLIALLLILAATPVLGAPAVRLGIAQCGYAPASPSGACPTNHFPIFDVGRAIGIHILAVDASGALASGYTGTVSFSSSDNSAILPAPHTFTVAENGLFITSITFNTPGITQSSLGPGTNQQWVTVSDAANNLTATTSIALQDDPLSPIPVPTLQSPLLLLLAMLVTAMVTPTSRRGLTTRSTGPAGTCLLLGERRSRRAG